MTNEEFFTTLKQVAKKHPFHVNKDGLLRTIDKDICPVCAVARKVLKKKFENHHHCLAQEALGMDFDLWAEVYTAADNYGARKNNFDYTKLHDACFPQEAA